MDVHQNAKTTPHGRRLMIERLAEGWTVARGRRRGSASRPRPWANGRAGMPRKARPASPTARRGRIAARPGCRTPSWPRSWRSAASACPDPPSPAGSAARSRPWAWSCAATGSAGSHALDPKPEIVRYQRERPGELIHLDIKKLGRIDGVGHRITGDRRGQKRGIGWEFLHVCVDDASRLAYTEILPDERKESAVAFLERALAWFASLGVTVERVMTDNGSAYRSHAFRASLRGRPRSSTSAPGPTRPGPTARPSASSRPACANGPTCKPSPAPPSAPPPCAPGSTATTDTDPTQPLAASLPSPGCPRTTSLVTTASGARSP